MLVLNVKWRIFNNLSVPIVCVCGFIYKWNHKHHVLLFFYLLSFFNLLNLPTNVALSIYPLLHTFHNLVHNPNPQMFKNSPSVIYSINHSISSKQLFLRWLVITIRYKIVFLLCLIMFEFLVELTKYNSIW